MGAMSTAQIFEHHLRVPASDSTVGNHVYYSRYLDWLEAARNEFFRAIGHPFPELFETGIMLPASASSNSVSSTSAGKAAPQRLTTRPTSTGRTTGWMTVLRTVTNSGAASEWAMPGLRA